MDAPEAGGRGSLARFYAVHLALGLALAAGTYALFEWTYLDLRIQELFYDAHKRRFPLRKNPWFEIVFHDGMKIAVILLGAACALVFALSFRKPALAPWRRRSAYVALCLALAPLTVALVKSASGKHCPYHIDRFGGHAPYTRLLEPLPPGVEPGGCWPAGHASGGFALLAFYFLWARVDRRKALAALALALLYGNVMGLSRVVQGAHFLSHQLW